MRSTRFFSRLFWYAVFESIAIVSMAVSVSSLLPSLPDPVNTVPQVSSLRLADILHENWSSIQGLDYFLSMSFICRFTAFHNHDVDFAALCSAILGGIIRLPVKAEPHQMASQTTITPHNQQPFVTRIYPSEPQLDEVITKASEAQKAWKDVLVEERIAIARKFTVRCLAHIQ